MTGKTDRGGENSCRPDNNPRKASGKVPHLSVAIHSYARIYSLKSAPSEQTQTNQAFTAASTRELRQEAARPHVEVFDGLSPQKKERLRGKQL